MSQPTKQTRIEQAIAFGRSDQWMRTHLGASNRDISAARNRIEAANSYVDGQPVHRPRPSRRAA